ncbi:MAG TPA: amidase [Candidatus Binatia bacterium]|jgi:amidase
MREIDWLDATAQAELVRKGDVSPRELVDHAIARIERLNPTLNAIIHPRFEKARAEADAPAAGPFRGVPFLLKDILGMQAGEPYHMGLRRLRDLGVAIPIDSYFTQKIQAAGFVILGRTNVPELGTLCQTESEAYGPCHNPWNLEHSTGGSSGGSSCAVAAGLVPAAHANDGGGSIRIPASECGLVGLKPSRGRTSFGPAVGAPVGGMVSDGVVTRSVRDTAAILDVLAGAMPGDTFVAPPPTRPYVREVGAPTGTLRIGLMTAAPGGTFQPHPDCTAAATAVAKALASLGHRIEEAHPDALDDAELGHHFTVMYSTHIAHTLDRIGELTGTPFTEADVDAVNWAMKTTGDATSAPRYHATVDWIYEFTRRIAEWHAGGFDLLLTPTIAEPPPRLGELVPTPATGHAVGMRAAQIACWTLPFNLTGQPGISLPLHCNAAGLPIGVQLVAAYGREDLLLRVAAALEAAMPWADRRPTLSR